MNKIDLIEGEKPQRNFGTEMKYSLEEFKGRFDYAQEGNSEL